MACADHKKTEREKTAKYAAHSRASAAENRPPTKSRSTRGSPSETIADATRIPRQATLDTESATWVANSKRFFCAQRLAKKGMDAAPAACARTAMGAVNNCLA